MGGDTLGGPEHNVLPTTLRPRGEGLSTSIVLESEEHIGRSMTPTAVHPALRSHDEKCLVRSRMEMAEGEPGPQTLRAALRSARKVAQNVSPAGSGNGGKSHARQFD